MMTMMTPMGSMQLPMPSWLLMPWLLLLLLLLLRLLLPMVAPMHCRSSRFQLQL
jgi:hypothetical protein